MIKRTKKREISASQEVEMKEMSKRKKGGNRKKREKWNMKGKRIERER